MVSKQTLRRVQQLSLVNFMPVRKRPPLEDHQKFVAFSEILPRILNHTMLKEILLTDQCEDDELTMDFHEH